MGLDLGLELFGVDLGQWAIDSKLLLIAIFILGIGFVICLSGIKKHKANY